MPYIEYKKKKVLGLKPHTHDWRDYSHRRTFGAALLSDLPAEYLLLTDIMDQNGYPKCTAYASCAVRSSQAGNRQFDPNWFYAQEGITAGTPSNDGYDLRTAMQTGVDYGFMPLAPKPGDQAADFKEASYFNIDGNYDIFDNIRSAMWLAKTEQRCAVLGTMWYEEWYSAPNGVILPGTGKTPVGLHAIKAAGWTPTQQSNKRPLNGTYLAVQNSFGKNFGDDGIYYFHRDVVNKEFVQGHFMWRLTLSDEDVKLSSRILDGISAVLSWIQNHLPNH